MNAEVKSLTNGEVIEFLVKVNDPTYNLTKAVEECTELNDCLIKRVNKGTNSPKTPSDNDIIEEIGDVAIRLEILKKIFGEKPINDRIQFKLDKYKQYITDGLYTGRI